MSHLYIDCLQLSFDTSMNLNVTYQSCYMCVILILILNLQPQPPTIVSSVLATTDPPACRPILPLSKDIDFPAT